MPVEPELQESQEQEDEMRILPPGAVVAERYRIEEVLGKGGMGVVYRALQVHMNRSVAMKMMLQQATASPQDHRRFQREAQAASLLNHPNIVTIYDFGFHEGQAYLCMDYLEGKNLDEVIEQKPLTLDQFRHIFGQACAALQHAHDKGIVHRDLKPSNMLVTERHGDPHFLIILDFGLVKMMESGNDGKLTMTNMVLGSPLYMSPEQCRALDLDHRSDIYSLACVMYESLAGVPPFIAATVFDMMNAHISQPPQSIREAVPGVYVPAGLDRVILKALSKNPDDRPQSMQEFGKEIESCFSGAPDVVLPTSSRIVKPAGLNGTGRKSIEVVAKRKKRQLQNEVMVGVAICLAMIVLVQLGIFIDESMRREPSVKANKPGNAQETGSSTNDTSASGGTTSAASIDAQNLRSSNPTGTSNQKNDAGNPQAVQFAKLPQPASNAQTNVPLQIQPAPQTVSSNYTSGPAAPARTPVANAVPAQPGGDLRFQQAPSQLTRVDNSFRSSAPAQMTRDQLKSAAEAAYQQRNYAEALRRYKDLNETNDADTVGKMAVAARYSGDISAEEYVQSFKFLFPGNAVNDYPLLAQIYSLLGAPSSSSDYEFMERFLQAERDAYRNAGNRLDDAYAQIVLNLNKLYMDQRKIDDALSLLRTAAQDALTDSARQKIQYHLSNLERSSSQASGSTGGIASGPFAGPPGMPEGGPPGGFPGGGPPGGFPGGEGGPPGGGPPGGGPPGGGGRFGR